CNFGADSNCSNLKNNYSEIRLWDYVSERFIKTGLQFCGIVMGDHSKCGINTMFNCGTVIGVFANVFGAGYPRNFIPSFAWGGTSGFSTYQMEKAFSTAQLTMARRAQTFGPTDESILKKVFEDTRAFRRWEKIILQ
ncbi:MAG: glucose-1-phosphate thymidylyltransferase, partial [Bacteroidota bacterium]